MFHTLLDAETVVDIFHATGPHKVVALKYGLEASQVRDIRGRRYHRKTTEMFTPEGMNALLSIMACTGRPL